MLPLGSDIGEGMPGEPAYYSGRITDTHGQPIANCCLDVWSGDGEGIYDMQIGEGSEMRLRGRFHTDADGSYRFWSIKPYYYPVPSDGPVGDMLRRDGPPPQPARPHPHDGLPRRLRAGDHAPVRGTTAPTWIPTPCSACATA